MNGIGMGAYEGYGVYEGFGDGMTIAAVPLPLTSPTTTTLLRSIRLSTAPVTSTQRIPIRLPATAPAPAKMAVLTITPASGMGAPTVGYVQKSGLWVVDPAALPAVEGVLATMTLSGDLASASGATAFFVLGQTVGDALTKVKAAVAAGAAVLVEKASPQTGQLKFLASDKPQVIASLASVPNATHALVYEQPQALVDQAASLAAGSALPSPLPGTGPASEGGSSISFGSQQPSWLVPAVIGVGAVAVVAAIVLTRKK